MKFLVAFAALTGLQASQGFVHAPPGMKAFAGTPLARRGTSAPQRSVMLGPHFSMTADDNGEMGWWDSLAKDLKKNLATATVLGALVASGWGMNPEDALAARSGGRMGGSSFRSAPMRTAPRAPSPSRSYGGGSYRGGGTTLMPVPVPMAPMMSPFGGFGYGYGGFSPFGFSPGISIGVNPIDIILLGGLAYGASQVLKGGTSRSWDDDELGYSSLGEGVDVVKLQVALNCPDRGPSSMLGQLSQLATRVDTSSRGGLSATVSEVCLAVLRKQADWLSAASDLEHFNRDPERADAKFSQIAIKERSKVEMETVAKVGGADQSMGRSGGGGTMTTGAPTRAVVTLVLALRGNSLKNLGLERGISRASDLRAALQSVASGVLTDEGDNVLAAEVLWTPEEPWEVLSREDTIRDFPELMDL